MILLPGRLAVVGRRYPPRGARPRAGPCPAAGLRDGLGRPAGGGAALLPPAGAWLAGRLQLQQELAADAVGARFAGGRASYLLALSRLAFGRMDGPHAGRRGRSSRRGGP